MQKAANPMHQALSLLARREHSIHELKQKLLARGHALPAVEDVIKALQERGYLDEKRYAEAMLRHHAMRGQGPQKIRYLLSQQQLANSLIAEVFSAFETDWFDLAAQARVKRFGLTPLPEERASRYKEQAKQMRFLMSRGFDQEQIQYALAQLGTR